jgi:hypothetical protein
MSKYDVIVWETNCALYETENAATVRDVLYSNHENYRLSIIHSFSKLPNRIK